MRAAVGRGEDFFSATPALVHLKMMLAGAAEKILVEMLATAVARASLQAARVTAVGIRAGTVTLTSAVRAAVARVAVEAIRVGRDLEDRGGTVTAHGGAPISGRIGPMCGRDLRSLPQLPPPVRIESRSKHLPDETQTR